MILDLPYTAFHLNYEDKLITQKFLQELNPLIIDNIVNIRPLSAKKIINCPLFKQLDIWSIRII